MAFLLWAKVASSLENAVPIYTRPVTSVLFEVTKAGGIKFYSAHVRRSLFECVIERQEILVAEQQAGLEGMGFPQYRTVKRDQQELGIALVKLVESNGEALKGALFRTNELLTLDLLEARRQLKAASPLKTEIESTIRQLEYLCR